MSTPLRAFLLPLSLLAACATYDVGMGVRPGVTSAEEVVRRNGPPAVEVADPDGGKSMAYPRGYFTGQTYMVRVGRDGMVQSVEQVLSDERFYRIVQGLTREDVLRLIGPPIETMDLPRLQQTAWDYRYRDTWGYDAILSVMFDRQGIVVGRTTRRLDRGGDDRSR
jgi:hypothetical protein